MVEFDYAFATDTLGGPKNSMMVATDSIHGSVFAVVARRKGGQDDYVMQSFQNYMDRLGLVEADLKCDQESSTFDVANALIKRCQSTAQIVTATPKGSKGSLGRGERANLRIPGQVRAFREAVSMKCKREVGPDHVLMGWMVRHFAWVINKFQVKGTRRTPYRSIRRKDYTGEVVPFGEVCLGRNHSEGGAKVNMRWKRGVFVGKLDRTDEFPLLTPTGARKTRCVRRLEGYNAWNLQFLNLCVGSAWDATARSTQQTPTIQQKVGNQQTCEKCVLATEHFGEVRTFCRMPRLCWKWAAHRSDEQELNKKCMKLSSGHLEIRKKLCQNLMSV